MGNIRAASQHFCCYSISRYIVSSLILVLSRKCVDNYWGITQHTIRQTISLATAAVDQSFYHNTYSNVDTNAFIMIRILSFPEFIFPKSRTGMGQTDMYKQGATMHAASTAKRNFWQHECLCLQHLEKILCRLLAENRSSCSDGWVVKAIALRKSLIHSWKTEHINGCHMSIIMSVIGRQNMIQLAVKPHV